MVVTFWALVSGPPALSRQRLCPTSGICCGSRGRQHYLCPPGLPWKAGTPWHMLSLMKQGCPSYRVVMTSQLLRPWRGPGRCLRERRSVQEPGTPGSQSHTPLLPLHLL